ncbi:hypothetical protein ABTM19_20180 [Acinetobacter baumannii]
MRQPAGDIERHTFTIEFLDSGVQAFAFTFGEGSNGRYFARDY